MSRFMTDEECTKLDSHPTDVTKILLMDFLFQGAQIQEKNSDISTQARRIGVDVFNQKDHNEADHRNILFHYTKCIAHAPNESEELALGYINRSIFLKHLQLYEECANDLEKAIAITKCDELKNKLQEGRKYCLEFLNDVKANTLNLKDLSLDEDANTISTFLIPAVHSQTLPDASDSITLRFSDIFGRQLTATRDIKPGEIISNETGFICFPNPHQLYLVCSHCLQFAWNAIPCSYCAYAVYCSDNCKNDAWQEYHDEECNVLPYFYLLTGKADILDVMAITRFLIKAIKKEGLDNILEEAKISNKRKGNGINDLLSDGILQNDKFKSYYNLMCNKNRIPTNDQDEHYESVAINLLLRFTNLIRPKESKLGISFEEDIVLVELMNLFVKFRNIFNANATVYRGMMCNCCRDAECSIHCSAKRGITIGPCSSLVNHSCNPNVEKMCVPSGKIVLFTTAPIKRGNQICVSYGPSFTTEKIKREKILEEQFFFSCECEACEENWPTYEEINCCKDPRIDYNMIVQPHSQFDKEMSSAFDKIVEQQEFDMKTLKYAIKYSELVYNQFENGMAFVMNNTFRKYISTTFYKQFGEKCIMPTMCDEI